MFGGRRLPHHTTKREAQAICDYAVDVIGALGLPGWRVLLMEDPCDDDCLACIVPVEGKYTAQLYVCTDWMKRDDDERRDTITHEVLHLLHFRVDHVLDDARDLMHDHEHDALHKRYRRETELMVDHLAGFLARTHTLRESWAKAHGKS